MTIFALQELRKRKNRYLLTILVIGLVVMMIITLNALTIAYQGGTAPSRVSIAIS